METIRDVVIRVGVQMRNDDSFRKMTTDTNKAVESSRKLDDAHKTLDEQLRINKATMLQVGESYATGLGGAELRLKSLVNKEKELTAAIKMRDAALKAAGAVDFQDKEKSPHEAGHGLFRHERHILGDATPMQKGLFNVAVGFITMKEVPKWLFGFAAENLKGFGDTLAGRDTDTELKRRDAVHSGWNAGGDIFRFLNDTLVMAGDAGRISTNYTNHEFDPHEKENERNATISRRMVDPVTLRERELDLLRKGADLIQSRGDAELKAHERSLKTAQSEFEFASKTEAAWKEQATHETSLRRGQAEQFGFTSKGDQQVLLNIASKFSKGGLDALSPKEQEFGKGSQIFQRSFSEAAQKRAEANPLFGQLRAMLGETRAEGSAKMDASIALEWKDDLKVEVAIHGEDIAKKIAKELQPKLDELDRKLSIQIKEQLERNERLRKNANNPGQ